MVWNRLPLEHAIESVLGQEALVVRPQVINKLLPNVVFFILRVQIEPVEKLHPLEALFVSRFRQVLVRALVVPWVGRMVPNHVKTFLRDCCVVRIKHAAAE